MQCYTLDDMLVKDESALFLLLERNSLVLGSGWTLRADFFRFAVEGVDSEGNPTESLGKHAKAPVDPFTRGFGEGRFNDQVSECKMTLKFASLPWGWQFFWVASNL
jgi:hypothetical protein